MGREAWIMQVDPIYSHGFLKAENLPQLQKTRESGENDLILLLLALTMEEVDLEKLEKAKEEILPWNLQKKCSPCQHLDFSLGRPIADSDLQNCMVKSLCCFMHYVCRELLYSSNQKHTASYCDYNFSISFACKQQKSS